MSNWALTTGLGGVLKIRHVAESHVTNIFPLDQGYYLTIVCDSVVGRLKNLEKTLKIHFFEENYRNLEIFS